MSKKETIRSLKRLFKICNASERGFNTVANTVNNRGLKILLKSYAQQRHQMANELEMLIREMGESVPKRRSFFGIIHRGRIILTATLTIEPNSSEKIALKEAMVGEKVALKTYEKALSKNLEPDALSLIQDQFESVQYVSSQVSRLRGLPGDRLVVRLFNSNQDVDKAIESLENVGFSRNMMEVVDLDHTTDFYGENRRVVDETVISGIVGGGIWGGVLGAILGFILLLIPGIQETIAMPNPALTWSFFALSGLISGALLGAILGLFIGVAVYEEDSFTYKMSLERGATMILLHTNRRRAPEASQIMKQINLLSLAGQTNH